jgi:uncharacterized protein YndB with AHSA1/START domain
MAASNPKSSAAKDTSDREIVITRVFDAPQDLLWEVFTNSEHLAQWWGPGGCTNTFQEISVKPGGVWRWVMRWPNGTEYQNKVIFDEVIKPERLVYTYMSDPPCQNITTFTARGEKTEMHFRMIFESAAERDKRKSGAMYGLTQTLDRLGEYLKQVSAR